MSDMPKLHAGQRFTLQCQQFQRLEQVGWVQARPWTRRDRPLKHWADGGGRRHRTVSGATMEVHAEMTLDYGTATPQTRRIERLLH
jgi:hypothetical protein